MRPINLSVKILLESNNPEETEEILNLLGFLDGQIISQLTSPEGSDLVEDIAAVIPQSIIILPDESPSETPNTYITIPISRKGLRTANTLAKAGVYINLTNCLTLEQAAAVYSATRDAESNVLISGFSDTDLLINTQRLYAHSDKHVRILNSNITEYYDFLYSLYIRPDYVSASFEVLKKWTENKLIVPQEINELIFNDKTEHFKGIHNASTTGITYKELDLGLEWTEFNVDIV